MTEPHSISRRASGLMPSQIRIIAEEGLARTDVIPLYFGESAWPTDAAAVNAAKFALDHDDHFYLPNNGRLSLREAIAGYLSALHRQPIGADRVTITASGTQALALASQILVDPGDDVICLEPAWPNIAAAFRIAGANVTFQNIVPRYGRWWLDLEELLEALTPSVRAVVINSPANPTGWAFPAQDQRRLLERCRETRTWLVVDEVYSRLYRYGHRAPSLLDFAAADDRVISINSFSKAWSMTGWRLGWIVAPPSLFGTLGKMTEFNMACAPGFVQAAGEATIRDPEPPIEILRKRLDAAYAVVESALSTLENVHFVAPDGGFYAFFSIDGVTDSVAFAQELLRRTGVGLAPGSAFGQIGTGWFRLCYAQPVDVLEEAFSRLQAGLLGIPG